MDAQYKTDIPQEWRIELDNELNKLGIIQKTGKSFITCETGEPYIQLLGNGGLDAFFINENNIVHIIKERGYLTKQDALDALKTEILEYAKDKSGTLYWRTEPEIDYSNCFKDDKCIGDKVEMWFCYTRLIITNKPRIK